MSVNIVSINLVLLVPGLKEAPQSVLAVADNEPGAALHPCWSLSVMQPVVSASWRPIIGQQDCEIILLVLHRRLC